MVHGTGWRDTSGPLTYLAQVMVTVEHLAAYRLPLFGMVKAIICILITPAGHHNAPLRFAILDTLLSLSDHINPYVASQCIIKGATLSSNALILNNLHYQYTTRTPAVFPQFFRKAKKGGHLSSHWISGRLAYISMLYLVLSLPALP